MPEISNVGASTAARSAGTTQKRLSKICQFGLRVAAVFLRRAAIRGAAAYRETLGFLCFFMVLPVGIEPTTSPLPRECSTTELRQRRCGTGPARSCKHIHDDPATGKASGRFATRTVASRVTFSAGSSHSLTGPALCRCIGKMGSDSSLTSRKSGERAAREERLAKALRENLRRRKEQVRAQEQRRCPPDKDPRGGGSEPPA